jgi:hypothetical protein
VRATFQVASRKLSNCKSLHVECSNRVARLRFDSHPCRKRFEEILLSMEREIFGTE